MRASAAGSRSRSFADALVGGLVFLLLGVVGFHLMRRGINLSDEGFLLMEVVDMLDGKVLYRDIETFHAPGIWLLLAGLFSVVEPSVLASRGAAALSYFAVAALIFRLVQKRAGLRYGFAGVAVYTALSVWSFPQWTWTWFSPYAVLFSLLAMHSLLAWRDDRRTRRLLVVGLWVGLAAAFKQNYGFFALVASLVGLLALRIEAREQPLRALRAGLLDSLGIGAGVLVAFLPFLLYFGYHGALSSILDLERFILYPLDFTTAARIPYLDFSALWSHGIFEDRGTSTNYLAQLALSTPTTIPLLPSLTEIRVLHAILYWLPPLVLAAGLVLSLLPKSPERPIDGELFVSTALSGLLFLGIFPRADFTHLVTVYQPLLVTGALVAHRVISRLPERLPSWTWVPVTSGVALFGFYALAAAAWLLYLVDSMVEELPQRRGASVRP